MKNFFKINTRVSYIFSNEKELILIDEKNRIFYFDFALHFKKGIKLKLLQNNKPDEKGVKISKSSKYLAISIGKNFYLWDLKDKKFLFSFTNKYDILAIGFSFDEKYIAFGDINGDVRVFNLKLKKEILKLPKHRDFIMDLTFSHLRDYIIAATFDKSVVFYNLLTFNKIDKYLHTDVVKKISLNNYLVSIDKKTYGISWNKEKIDIDDIIKFYDDFRDFIIDEDFLLIATKRRVIIYNLKEKIIENENFLELNELDKINIFNNLLILSTKNGELYYRNLFEEEIEFLDYILKEKYKEAFELIDKNPFLKRSKGYEKLNKIIELIIKKAKKLFEIDEAKALELLDKLLIVPQLRRKIREIIENFKNLKKLKLAIKNKNFSLAYQIIKQNPLLKETRYYLFLEKYWEKVFQKAKELVFEGKIEEAKKLLEPFMSVSEKLPLINKLLYKSELFKLLKEKLANKDFRGFFDLIKIHPELKRTKEYIQVMNYMKTLYKFAIKYIEEEKFEKAKKIIMILQQCDEYEDKAKELLNRIEITLKFLYLIQNSPHEAILMSEKYPYLKSLKEYKEFIQKYNSTLENVEELIQKGEHSKAEEILKSQKIHNINRVKYTLTK